MLKLKQYSLVHQISLAATIVSVVIFSTLILFTSILSERSALAKTEEELSEQVKGIVQMLELSHGNAVGRSDKGLGHVKESFGKLRFGPDTMTLGRYQLPVVRSGDRIVNENTALLEQLRSQTDTDPALLIRVGDEFVRAATLLKDKDGKSSNGTALPQDSREVQSLLAGKPYKGVVRRTGRYYVSALDPIFDESGKVIGAVTARVDVQADMERLFQAVANIKSGATGYAYILAPNTSDHSKSEFIYHPKMQGKTLADVNNPIVQRISEEQTRKKEGTDVYGWPREDGSGTDDKMTVFRTVPSWGWVVAAGSYIDEFTVEARHLRNVLIGLCVAGAVLLTVVLYLITRHQLAPIHTLLHKLEQIGAGDLSIGFPATNADSRNELDQMSLALSATTHHVGMLIGDVKRAANAVRDVAETVRQGSDEVVDGTSAQSEAAAGLASAIEELSVSITHVSGSAATARDITQQAQQHAEHGGTTVRQMIGGMDRISSEIDKAGDAVNLLSERSARISNIGKIINDIADQTNLLALNAAIEAARAGESGRGFAVVADEVRKLAERTATSTREISSTVSEVQSEAERVVTMIRDVTEEVRDGVRLATDSGAVLETIRTESDRTTSAVNDIADATREQSAASQEVARGVERIAQMAEQNNEVTRRTNDQVATLEQLASELQSKVAHFQL